MFFRTPYNAKCDLFLKLPYVQNLAVLPKLSSDILWPGIKPAEKYIRKTTKTSFQEMEQKRIFIKIIFKQIPMKIKLDLKHWN